MQVEEAKKKKAFLISCASLSVLSTFLWTPKSVCLKSHTETVTGRKFDDLK